MQKYDLPIVDRFRQGNLNLCQGNVREMSGNFVFSLLYEPCLLNKMAVRAENRKKLKMTSPPRPEDRFQNNFTEMFLG